MKILIYSIYITAASLILVALLGGSATKTLVDGYSIKSLQMAGIDRAKVDSLDALIDVSVYNMNLMMYKIEKFKNTLTFQNDNSKPLEFQKNKYINDTVYEPLKEAITYLFRGLLFTSGIILFMLAAIIHSFSSYFNLRYRVRILEERILISK